MFPQKWLEWQVKSKVDNASESQGIWQSKHAQLQTNACKHTHTPSCKAKEVVAKMNHFIPHSHSHLPHRPIFIYLNVTDDKILQEGIGNTKTFKEHFDGSGWLSFFLAALKEIWHIPDHKDTMQSQMHAYKQSLKYAYNHASKQPSTHTHTPHMICKSLVQFPKIDLFVTGTWQYCKKKTITIKAKYMANKTF